MPYTKPSAIAGAKDKIEIIALNLNLQDGSAEVYLRTVTLGPDGTGTPEVSKAFIAPADFAAIAQAAPAGATLYDAVKTPIYQHLIDTGVLPPAADGWTLS